MDTLIRNITLILLLLLLVSCPKQEEQTTDTPVTTDEQSVIADQDLTGIEANSEGAPRQLILIYTGGTLSIPEANPDYKPPEGGLSALMDTIFTYEGMIVDYNRIRVENEGGNPDEIRVDLTAGMLGEHPFMLLDYGLWERPNDRVGETYVDLYFHMFKTLKYTAVGFPSYYNLPDEQMQSYSGLDSNGVVLLRSVGEDKPNAPKTVSIVTREAQGSLWGIVSIPLPPEGTVEEMFPKYLEDAKELLKENNCAHSILLLPDAPPEFYVAEKEKSDFTVIIGTSKYTGITDGYGDMPKDGALMLPILQGGGRRVGICHIYYPQDGSQPNMYYFSNKYVYDEGDEKLPLRKQVNEAVEKHKEDVAGLRTGS